MPSHPLVVAFGGGTNSLAVLLGLAHRGIIPDLIHFLDTGGEKPATYRAIEVANDWCVAIGFPAITILKSLSPTHGFEGLEGMVLRNGTLPSKTFGYKSCSQRCKIEPSKKFLNHWEPARIAWAEGRKVTVVLGYDAGEPQRAKDYSNNKEEYWYPLIEWGWDRDKCVEVIQASGLPLPGKSACFFCPSSRKNEVIQLAQSHPDLFARAVEMERNAKASGKLGVVKGLGRHWSWEELVAASETQRQSIPENRMTIDCACFDGESDE